MTGLTAVGAAPAGGSTPTMTIKSVGAIAIDATVVDAPAIGVPGVVEIRVRSARSLTDVSVAVGADDGLDVLAVDGARSAAALDAGVSLVLRLDVLALEPGRHGLPVFVRGRAGQQDVARSVVVPIAVGDPSAGPVAAERKSGNSFDDPVASGAATGVTKSDDVRSMRAAETIR